MLLEQSPSLTVIYVFALDDNLTIDDYNHDLSSQTTLSSLAACCGFRGLTDDAAFCWSGRSIDAMVTGLHGHGRSPCYLHQHHLWRRGSTSGLGAALRAQ